MWAALAISIATAAAPVPQADARTLCKAPPPAAGQTVRGPVLHVPNSRQMCVAAGADPSQWTPVRLAEPALTRGRLMAAAFGRNAACEIGQDGRGVCRIEGDALADRLNRPGVVRASADWR